MQTKPPKTELQKLRDMAGFTTRGLARSLCCDCGLISRWERYHGEPGPRYRSAYAKALGVSVGHLGSIIYVASVKKGNA